MSKQNNSALQPTPNDPDFFPIPGEEVITVRLDTGRVVQMVIAELEMLYEAGDIPDQLTPIAARQLFPPPKEENVDREKRYFEQFGLAKHIVQKVLRSPIVVATPMKPGEITIKQLYRDEIWQIYRLTNDPAAALENFRRQQGHDVETVSGLQNVGRATESTPALAAAP